MAGRFWSGRWVEWTQGVEPGTHLCPVCEELFTTEEWPGSFRIVPRKGRRYDAVATCSFRCASA
jgi:hypothetical protein